MVAFLMFWSVLSVVGLFMAVTMIRSGNSQENHNLVGISSKPSSAMSGQVRGKESH